MSATKPAPGRAPRKTTVVPAAKAASQKSLAASARVATGQWIAFARAIVDDESATRIRRIRTGAKANHLVGAANALRVSRETIFNLVGLPASTANRKIANGETLDVSVTERLARLALIEQEAVEAFGDAEIAREWLLTENVALGGCSPLSLLDTDIGAREVSRALVSIAYGGVV